jgi:hypothetical protein
MRRSTLCMAFAIMLMLVPLGSDAAITHAQSSVGQGVQPGVFNKSTGKLSTRLALLAQPHVRSLRAAAQAQVLSLPEAGPGSLIRSADGAVLTYIRVSDTSAAQIQALRQAGARIVHVAPAYGIVTAYVDADHLSGVAALHAVQNMREEMQPKHFGTPERPATQPRRAAPTQAACPTGSMSEGDAQLNVGAGRTAYNVDGAGITVGIISDSYNRATAATTAEQDIASGDLPGPANPCGAVIATHVISESTDAYNTDEGRAMLQIVHDLAPAANLAFATANNGLFGFADNIRALRSQAGANVIVDDIGYFTEPFFQDGPVDAAINDVVSQGALYTTAAGNDNVLDGAGNNITSYEAAAYRPMACPALSGSSGAPTTAYAKDCHNFNPAGESNSSGYVLGPNGQFILLLQWAEPWFGVQTDIDVYMVDSTGHVLDGSNDTNTGTNGSQMPLEAFQYVNRTGAPQTVSLVIARASGSATPRVKYQFASARGIAQSQFNATTNTVDQFGPSIYGHAGSENALSVAAVPYSDASTPEAFTSLGLRTVYFETAKDAAPAAALAQPIVRNKPDIAATDGVQTTFFAEFIDGVYRFYGTSAAAPHAAAVGALLKQLANQRHSIFGQTTLEQVLRSTASPIPHGSAQASGAGLINAAAALEAVTGLPEPLKTFLPLTANN